MADKVDNFFPLFMFVSILMIIFIFEHFSFFRFIINCEYIYIHFIYNHGFKHIEMHIQYIQYCKKGKWK